MPIGTGELRRIQPRMLWMLRPVERSITVSAPQRIAQTSFSTSSAAPEVTAELPMLALILTRKLRPMMTGSSSGWLMLAGMMARPRGDLRADELGRDERRDRGAEILAVGAPFGRTRQRLRAAEILAMRDVDHLLGDDAGAGELELRDLLAGLAGEHGAVRRAGRHQPVGRDVAVVLGLDRARRDRVEAAPGDPRRAAPAAGRPRGRWRRRDRCTGPDVS